MAASKKSRLLDFLLVFAVVYLVVEFGMRWFFPKAEPNQVASITLSMKDASVALGNTPITIIHNNTQADLTLPCPNLPLALYAGGASSGALLESFVPAHSCDAPQVVKAGKSLTVELNAWKNKHFTGVGDFQLQLHSVSGTGADIYATPSASFSITEPGAFTKGFRAFITKPLFNALIFIASLMPGHNLGLSIIILTIIVKLILFIPTQHALEGQKKMQLLQPKFEAVRKQYKDDPKKMQAETMKIWKEHKINPMQSCLPLVVQFPVLIGLFYTIRDGVHLSQASHLVYPFYQDIDWTFGTQFLGLDLTVPYVWIFPPILVALQFFQMKLSFMIADKKKAKQIAATVTPEADTPQEMQQRIMLYALPLMIGFFALTMPSAVCVYWGISTLFAIGQQMIVNREHIKA